MGESEPRIHLRLPTPAAAVELSTWLCYVHSRHRAQGPDGIRNFRTCCLPWQLLHRARIPSHWLGSTIAHQGLFLEWSGCRWCGGNSTSEVENILPPEKGNGSCPSPESSSLSQRTLVTTYDQQFSATPAGGPTAHLSSDPIYLEIRSDPTRICVRFRPQSHKTPPSHVRCQSQVTDPQVTHNFCLTWVMLT